jgi:hypothetical protein
VFSGYLPLKQILIIDGFKSIAEAMGIDNIKGFDVIEPGMKRGIDRLRAFVLNCATDAKQEQWWLVIVLVFILHLVLALPILMPNLKDIGMYDRKPEAPRGRCARHFL